MLQTALSFFRTLVLYKILKIKTCGVRVAVLDHDKVLLVKHTYNSLWVFPGGGVNKGETELNAAIRECKEEAEIEIKEPIIKFADFINNKNGKDDMVTLFICRNWSPVIYKRGLLDYLEIADKKWFYLNNLPNKISESTKQRLFEIQHPNTKVSKIW